MEQSTHASDDGTRHLMRSAMRRSGGKGWHANAALADGSGFLCVPSEDCGWREQGRRAGSRPGRHRRCRPSGGWANSARAGRRMRAAGPSSTTRPRLLLRHAQSRRLEAFPRSCFPAEHLQKGPRVSFSFPHHRHEARSMRAMPARAAEQEPIASRPDPSTATLWSVPSLPTSAVGGVRSTSSS
jgi:hypothetical protein